MSAQFCKEVLSLNDEQIVYTSGEFFVDSPGTSGSAMSLASAIVEGMDAVDRKFARAASGSSSSSSKDAWKLVPFKRTTELCLLESKLKGRIKVLSESLESSTGGGILHRHVSSPEAGRVTPCCAVASQQYDLPALPLSPECSVSCRSGAWKPLRRSSSSIFLMSKCREATCAPTSRTFW